jgi:DNA-binding response OmpR family regulator
MFNVLIAEDDLTIADLLQEGLEAEGFAVTAIVRTFAEAVEAVGQTWPDFAVIDVQLADGDLGTDVAAYLCEGEIRGIVLSTGNDSIGVTAACADAVMTKPYRLRDVGRALRILDERAACGTTSLAFPRSFALVNRQSGHARHGLKPVAARELDRGVHSDAGDRVATEDASHMMSAW